MSDQKDSSKPDRVLGDEWEDWSGELDESIIYNETALLFTVYAATAVMTMLVAMGAALYLVEPRLRLIHPTLMYAARITVGAAVAGIVLCGILIVVSVYTGRSFLVGTRFGQVAASRILPLALTIAQRLGISRDRLGNSFVSFNNAIVRASHRPGRGNAIILLPRCLNPDLRKTIKELGDRAEIGVFTAGGGGQARKIILRERPGSVIGVACERDLISGIHDVAPKITTIGIPNRRPEGPCKNTLIDLDDLKHAIATLTGRTID